MLGPETWMDVFIEPVGEFLLVILFFVLPIIVMDYVCRYMEKKKGKKK